MSESTPAVFLSYASDDREAAQRICDALRAAGIEVWFDQSELRGGDAWDNKIRAQIKNCALFLVVLSQHACARDEGYFRLEWKLAIDRSYQMSATRPFLVPVAIDATPETSPSLPDRFRDVQWMRLPDGLISQAFVDRMRRLLSSESAKEGLASSVLQSVPAPRKRSGRWLLAAVGAIGLSIVAAVAVRGYWLRELPSRSVEAANTSAPPAFKAPEHSIAVMPFANLSGDASQEYFSDGLSEEILDSFSRLNGIRVAARSASFSFKGKNDSVADMAHKLNVGALLEGSVRRAGNKVRISAHLIDASSGFELWSQTYDRELKDILALQAEIANAVTQSLKITLTQDISSVVEVGGTRNPEALDDLFRAQRQLQQGTREGNQAALALADQAIRLDPGYADAYVIRAKIARNLAALYDPPERVGSRFEEARKDAEQAIQLAPGLMKAHAQYAMVLQDGFLDFRGAQRQLTIAGEIGPNDTSVLRARALLSAYLLHPDEAIELSQRAIALDPQNGPAYSTAALTMNLVGRPEEGLQNADHALSMGIEGVRPTRCVALYILRRFEEVAASCRILETAESQAVSAAALHALHRQDEAQRVLDQTVKENGDAGAFQYAEVYSQWGNTELALHWIERAYELKDGGLVGLQVHPLLNPIRNEPRFQAVVKKLNFPP